MNIMLIFEQTLVMLFLLAAGVIAAKAGVMDEESSRRFTSFNLMIPQSCMILSSILGADIDVSVGRVFGILGTGVLMYAILVAVGMLVPQIYRCKPEDKGLYSFMTIFGNVGFMGIPIAKALLGDSAALYAAILNIPFNILAYTFGIALLSSKGNKEPINWRLLLNVPLVVSALSIVLLCFRVRLAGPFGRAVDMLGDMILPGSMVIIGASLGRQDLKAVFGDWRVYLFAPARLVAVPLILWGIMHFIVKDPVFLGTMTLQGAMPVAAFATMLSIEYGGNVEVASKTVFVTTVLSVITIPLVVGLLPL